MTGLDAEILAIRTGVAVHRPGHAIVAVRGPGAYDAVDAISSRDVLVRAGQVLHSLLLRDDATVAADLYVCPTADGVLLLADGVDGPTLRDVVRQHAPAAVELDDLTPDHDLLALEGPYAWELTAALCGSEFVTLGYMARAAVPAFPGVTLLRLGTTGEYGYVLMIPHAQREAVEAALAALAPRFGLTPVSTAAVDRCALENGFFSPRHFSPIHQSAAGLTPIELQLQWRVTYDRDYRGSEALRARRSQADVRRVAWVIGRLEEPLPAPGGTIVREGAPVGVLLAGDRSPILGCFVGLALLDRALAHPWIDGFYTPEGAELRTEAPPLLHNRSLFIDPRQHTYATRERDSFPPITPEAVPEDSPA